MKTYRYTSLILLMELLAAGCANVAETQSPASFLHNGYGPQPAIEQQRVDECPPGSVRYCEREFRSRPAECYCALERSIQLR